MELMLDRVDGAPLPSATVVLLRDGVDGLEVFLLRRHGQSEVLGGAYVFPGGKVDPEDAEAAECNDTDSQRLHALLAEPELAPVDAAALFVSAIREVFEECGVLFAQVTPAQARDAWAALHAGQPFPALLAAGHWHLAASSLQPWSRWITPTRPSLHRRRFDTRFFVATVPTGQEPLHDSHEATASLWLSPRAALQQYWDGTIDLAPPQIMSLVHLARHRTSAGVLQAAREGTPPCIRPQPFDVDGVRTLCYPGDPWHDERVQLLPGPTRLYFRNRHFEPDGGLAKLLGD